MKKLLKFIFIIGPCFFLLCMNTKALENTYYYTGLNISTNGLYTDNSSASAIGSSIGYDLHQTNFSSNNYLAVSPTSNLSNRIGNYGVSLTQCDMSFISGNYYSVTYYFEHALSSYPHWSYSKVNYHLGISNSSATNYLKRNFNPISYTTDVQTIYAPTGADGTGFLSSFTIIFKAPENGTCLTMAYSSSNIDVPISTYTFVGYEYKALGGNAPSSADIKNELNSSFDNINANITNISNNIMTGINTSIDLVNDNINNATNDINNNINNATNSINDNINDMSNKVDNSINSEDSDTSSSKCGIVCKLKGIWTGIVHLPEYIWNFLKQGFDSIINIFKPEDHCEVSKNLFDFNQDYNKVHSSSSNILQFIKLDNGFRLVNKSSTATLKLIYDVFPVNKYNGKTLTISANVSTGGSLQIGYRYATSVSNYYVYDTTNKYTSSHSLTIDSNKTNGSGYVSLYFLIEPGQVVDFTDIMLVEGNEVLTYEEFGKETCTGGGSFFDWFGNFFKSIVSGILELPSKLVSLLLEGLKSLFVPTQEHLMDILEESKKLTENFGFVGEAMNFFLNIFTSLLGLVNQNGCIQLPEFSIGATSLFEAHTFWQAQNVCLSDNAILSANIDTIRTITSIALVTLFINFAVRKFFGILSKNDNEVIDNMAKSTRGEV